VSWGKDASSGAPRRSAAPALLRKEVETCGLCHARRGEFSEAFTPGAWLSDTHEVAPIARRLFHPDGQMRDGEETYNYAPFKQSKMFAAGVTCSDCHDPHGAKLRAGAGGVCLQCHAGEKYQTAAHQRHEGVAPALTCVSCHMPARTYMVIDRRHDHGFRVPRPDLSMTLGTPNACNDCHKDKPASWAAAHIETWFGAHREGFQNWAEAFHAAWTDQADADRLLAAMARDGGVPALVRASALTALGAPDADLTRRGLADPDPMVRIATLDMLEAVPAERLWPVVSPLLADPVRGVRIKAAALLASVPPARQPAADRDRFEHAAAEFVAAQDLNADRPEGRTALGNFLAKRSRPAEAEAQYKAALRLDPHFAAAAVNLSDLYRQLGRDGEGETVLRTAIAASPRDAALHYALGLTLTRLKRPADALDELRRAYELEPERARYGYVYAVALHSAGRADEAMAVLKEVLARHPADRDSLLAAVTFSRDAGDFKTALEYAERLAKLLPGDPGVAALIGSLRRQLGLPNAQ
jgi:predicted CXXCH cytochrome family protein